MLLIWHNRSSFCDILHAEVVSACKFYRLHNKIVWLRLGQPNGRGVRALRFIGRPDRTERQCQGLLSALSKAGAEVREAFTFCVYHVRSDQRF